MTAKPAGAHRRRLPFVGSASQADVDSRDQDDPLTTRQRGGEVPLAKPTARPPDRTIQPSPAKSGDGLEILGSLEQTLVPAGSEPDASSPRSDATSGAPRIRTALEAISFVVAPTTLVTALLLYFAWVHVNAYSLYFGLDPSALQFSTQDYLLRSVKAVFFPFGAICLVALLFVWFHAALRSWVAAQRHLRFLTAIVPASGALGISMFLYAMLLSTGRLQGMTLVVTPMSFACGIGLTSYAVYLHAQLAKRRTPSRSMAFESRAISSLALGLVSLLIVLSLFWAVGDWADGTGRGRAETAAQGVTLRPGVVVYSPKRLHIKGPGVTIEELLEPDSAYRFRYSGLKLLVRSAGKYFLVPAGWSPAGGAAMVIPDSPTIRVEFTPR